MDEEEIAVLMKREMIAGRTAECGVLRLWQTAHFFLLPETR